jgi:hypothetical protein
VPTLIGKTINASGGVEGYSQPAQFAPGQSITGLFTPFTIPDRFLATLLTSGTVLQDTGFIGNGATPTINFTVPTTSDGLVLIQVLTNDPGTAWTFTLSTQGSSAPQISPLAVEVSSARFEMIESRKVRGRSLRKMSISHSSWT